MHFRGGKKALGGEAAGQRVSKPADRQGDETAKMSAPPGCDAGADGDRSQVSSAAADGPLFGSAQGRHRGARRAIGIGRPLCLQKEGKCGPAGLQTEGLRANSQKKVALQVIIKP